MPNIKTIRISVDQASWTSSPVPNDILITAQIGQRWTDADLTLIHTALWTRPPEVLGFSLSDCWAWLRYARALAPVPDLRLRPEWEDIDTHQKTVLSGELGVGFTTELLSEQLNFLAYVDTRYFVRAVLPEYFVLGQTSRRGPSKSPDYVAIDNNLEFSVLECKGSQTSLGDLESGMRRGIAQKANIFPLSSSSIRHSLVAGLYIARWANPFQSTIRIMDPVFDEQKPLPLELPEVPPRELRIGFVLIVLAKHFALMGAPSLANALSKMTVGQCEGQGLPLTAFEDFAHFDTINDEPTFEIVYPLPIIEKYGTDVRSGARRVKFRMSCSRGLYELLRESRDLCRTFEDIFEGLRNMKWKSKTMDHDVQLWSPFGFQLALTYD